MHAVHVYALCYINTRPCFQCFKQIASCHLSAALGSTFTSVSTIHTHTHTHTHMRAHTHACTYFTSCHFLPPAATFFLVYEAVKQMVAPSSTGASIPAPVAHMLAASAGEMVSAYYYRGIYTNSSSQQCAKITRNFAVVFGDWNCKTD